MTRRPLSARRAREIIDGARLVKAPDWRESRNWHVVSGGETLVVIAPRWKSGQRSGWTWWIAGHTPNHRRNEPNREQAAVAGLDAWQRWVTSKETT